MQRLRLEVDSSPHPLLIGWDAIAPSKEKFFSEITVSSRDSVQQITK
jgi:hypothetical protein